MSAKPSRRSSLFLLELIIAILFFILAATACVQVFTQAQRYEADSQNLDQAIFTAASLAELLGSQRDPFPLLEQLYPEGNHEADCYRIYYDQNWTICSAGEETYTVCLNVSSDAALQVTQILVSSDEALIYQLETKTYQPSQAAPDLTADKEQEVAYER